MKEILGFMGLVYYERRINDNVFSLFLGKAFLW